MGVFTGTLGYVTIAILVVAALAIMGLMFVAIYLGKRERKEDEGYDLAAEYGVKGEKKDTSSNIEKAIFGQEAITEEIKPEAIAAEPEKEEIKPEPIKEEKPIEAAEPESIAETQPIKDTITSEPVKEPEPAKAADKAELDKDEAKPAPAKKEEVKPAKEEKREPIKEAEKAEEVKPIPEKKKEEKKPEPDKKPVKPDAAAKKTVKKKPDNWSNYDGAYDGYYYDPEDACYYAGEAPTALLKQKNAAKEAEFAEANKKTGAKKIIKKIAPPSAALTTPKHDRKPPKKAEGFDESVIYGKYVIESENGEYYFTLYSNKEENLFESKNYSSEEFARKAIARFKSQVLVGTFVVKPNGDKFHFVLTRKGSVNEGNNFKSIIDANKNIQDVKYYATTDIIRVQ